jgi:V8-like Glu-specific endopeptidase
MSHITGSVQQVNPVLTIGPASGTPPTSPNTWAVHFDPPAAPTGTRLLILHFRNASFPANNRLEVDLGYGTDVFTSADGAEFWTRPVDVYATGGSVDIRYITNGSNAGGVEFDRYGRGERMHSTEPDHVSFTNSDPFLNPAVPVYEEPGTDYDPFWFCAPPPNWENVARVTDPTDVRFRVAQAVGMIVTIHGAPPSEYVSTCSVTLVDADVILTAGHCHTPAEERSAWWRAGIARTRHCTSSCARPAARSLLRERRASPARPGARGRSSGFRCRTARSVTVCGR